MLTLARLTVRGRRRTFISPFIALMMAASLVTAAGVLMESGIRGSAAPDRYAGAAIVVAGRQSMANPLPGGETVGLPERVRVPVSLADRVAAVPGVRSVVADRTVPVTVAAANGRVLSADDRVVLGHGWSSAALLPVGAVDGHAPRLEREVALDAMLAADGAVRVGDVVRITSADGTHPYDVVGLVAPAERASRRNVPVYFSDDAARRLSGDEERVDALGVLVDSQEEIDAVAGEIRSQLGPQVTVLTGGARARPESLDVALRNQELVEFSGAFGGTAVMLAVFVVAATLGLSVLQRGREMALLRAVGATPRQVRRMVVREAAIVALAAGVAGAGPGLLLGTALFGVLRAAGIAAESTQLRLGPLPVAAAVAAGLVAASFAALLAGRRAARIRPTAALSEAAIEPRRIGWLRLLLGVVLLSGGLVLSAVGGSLEGEEGASAAVGVLLTLIIGIALLGPVLARGAGSIGGPLVASMSRTSGFLAMSNVRARARRLASASTPLALAVALTLTMVGSLATEAKATERQSHDRIVADRVLAAPNGLPAGLVATVRSVPGVAAAVEVLPTMIGVVHGELFGERVFEMRPAVGLSTQGIEAVLDLDVHAGSVTQLATGGVALSTEIARSVGVDVGDDIPLSLGDGTLLTRRVVVTYARSLGFGDFVISREDVAPHVTNPMADQVLVTFDDQANERTVDAALTDLEAQTPGLTVVDRTAVQAELAQIADQTASVNYLFVAVLASFVTVAMANSLVLGTAERSIELALLRLVGATPRQVLRMIRWEAVILITFGTVLGFAVAAATLVPFSIGIAGSPVPAVPLPFVATVIASAFALGIAATELPARAALRTDPIEVISTPA